MRRIAHISDLHFGAEDPQVAEGLLEDLAQINPHLVAVSGDLTQRAKRSEFVAARRYLDRISAPRVVVPGNHDLPLYQVLRRFFRPLSRYQRFIGREMHPWFEDDEIAVAGVNTARSNTWKDGRISLAQINKLRTQFDAAPRGRFKVLVAHHPFIPPQNDPRAALVGRARLAVKTLEACGCALVLAGHLHQAYSGDVRPYHVEIKRSVLVAQAGTAISHRRRDEPNAYNLITADGARLLIEVRAWSGTRFCTAGTNEYQQSDEGWIVKRAEV